MSQTVCFFIILVLRVFLLLLLFIRFLQRFDSMLQEQNIRFTGLTSNVRLNKTESGRIILCVMFLLLSECIHMTHLWRRAVSLLFLLFS